MKKKMFYGAHNFIFERAKQLRNNLTEAESILWEYLRQKPLGYKFRRQHPMGIYIADFYCHALKLVIELDGSIHNKPDIVRGDKIRQTNIENEGVTVLRFKNNDVELQLEKVINEIELYINNQK
jgi:cyclase